MNEASAGGTSASEASRDFERDAVAGFQRFVAQVVQRADHAALLRRDPLPVDVDLGAEACALQLECRGIPASGGQRDLAAVPEPSFGGARGVHRNARDRRCSGILAVDAVFPRAVQAEIGMAGLCRDRRGTEKEQQQQGCVFFHSDSSLVSGNKSREKPLRGCSDISGKGRIFSGYALRGLDGS